MFVKSGLSFVIFLLIPVSSSNSQPSWDYTFRCSKSADSYDSVKVLFDRNTMFDEIPISLDINKLLCSKYGSLWPRPTGATTFGTRVGKIHPANIKFDFSKVDSPEAKEYLQKVSKIFHKRLFDDCGDGCRNTEEIELIVRYTVSNPDLRLTWETDESYILNYSAYDVNNGVDISSDTVYGARHALETLSQLFSVYEFKNSTRVMFMVSKARIEDAPAYPHRGLLLDTARNFLSVATIKRTLDAMAMTKLNVLHWHATDSQSFPLEIPSVPQMVRYGAYSDRHIYSTQDINYLMEYAKLRGIRIIFELDAPAHAGNGWQWGQESKLGNLAVCVNEQPWQKYCIQPPCGQLNPTNSNTYKILGKVFKDLINLMPFGEAFHMGGDEVYFPCWNSSSEIVSWMESQGIERTNEGFTELWGYFQKFALQAFDEANPESKSPIILWSSHLTYPKIIEKYLEKDRYIIETWLEANSTIPQELLHKGYKLIMGTKDKWYLDHGFWGNTIYHKWTDAYDNKLPNHKNVLGGETMMWSELVDDYSIDIKVWPRAAAVAERLWTNPEGRSKDVMPRILQFRRRLIRRGVNADALGPLFCEEHEGECS